MNNTSKDIAELYTSAAVSANTKEQFKNRVLAYLMPQTKIGDENQFFINEVNWDEL